MPEFTPDMPVSPEAEREYSSRIVLHFFRHGDKTKEVDGDKSNVVQVLTETGAQQGVDKGVELGPAKPTAMAKGGDVKRSRQMAGYALAGAEGRDDITGAETIEELEAKLNEGRKVGTRMAEDPRLSFHYESDELWEACDEAYDRGEGLKWFVEESDEFAAEHCNDRETSYSRMASNIAQVLQDYNKIAVNYDRLVSNEEKMKQYGDTLQRFMGSHAGSIDFFLAKLVEVMRGSEERDRFVRALDNQMFDVAEGFDIEIEMIDGQPQMRISYEREPQDDREGFEFNEVIGPEVLEQIVEEGEATKTGKV